MKKLAIAILVISAVGLIGCSAGNNDDSVNNVSPKYTDVSSNTLSQSEKDIEYNAISDDGSIERYDFENAYALCVQAITDYQSARINNNAVDFSKYIANPALIDYIEKSINAPKEAHGLLTAFEVNMTALNEHSVQKNRMYLNIAFGNRKGAAVVSRSSEFIVENIDGRLVISEWYSDGKDSFDTCVRGYLDVKNNDVYWDNYDAEQLDKDIITHLDKFRN